MLLILSPKEKLLLLEYVSFLKIKFTLQNESYAMIPIEKKGYYHKLNWQ